MNQENNLDLSLINDKTKNIDNTFDIITELFSDNLFNEKEPGVKYFIFSTFLLKNIKFPFQEIWRLFKIIISINPNITMEKTECNKYFGYCLKLCTKLLHKSISNLNLDKDVGFKCKEVPALFDFFFSFPLVKHYINLIENIEQKNEVNEILDEVINLISEKIKIGKNTVAKNMFINFYHFLDVKENKIIIPTNEKSNSISVNESNSDKKNTNTEKINRNNINKLISNENTMNSSLDNNSHFSQLKDNKTKPHSKNNSQKKEKNNTEIKVKKNSVKEDNPKIKNTKKTNNNNSIGKYISSKNKKNVNEEIKTFQKYIKGIINKVNNFINFEEMKRTIKLKLPGNYLMQIGSFLYMAPFPDLSNINIDLLISRQNNSTN